MQIKLIPAKLQGIAAAPASKSEAHRMMICAGLTRGKTELQGFMTSADMRATAGCLRALGADLALEGDVLKLNGFAHKPELVPLYDCG